MIGGGQRGQPGHHGRDGRAALAEGRRHIV